MEGGERFDEISYHVQLLSNLKFGFTQECRLFDPKLRFDLIDSVKEEMNSIKEVNIDHFHI